MLNFENANLFGAAYMMANCSHYLRKRTSSSFDEFDDSIWTFIQQTSKQPIFWIMKDKAKCEAAKLSANLTIDKAIGAEKNKNYDEVFRHLSEGVNKIIRINLGEIAFGIIANHNVVTIKLIKNAEDMYKTEISLLIASAGLAMREELLINGLYKGSLN
jgi:hypothetical protein